MKEKKATTKNNKLMNDLTLSKSNKQKSYPE